MALKLRFEISPQVISTEAQLDESLLMNTRTLAYFGLDPLGSKFWRAMQLHQDADEVIAVVAEETGKNALELEPVLQSIMTGMERSGLLSSHNY
ncbi:MAG: PqqD family protein [Xanthomonadales bacterium]|nr:PqqD family protein [Xanthomonadales bacterium]